MDIRGLFIDNPLPPRLKKEKDLQIGIKKNKLSVYARGDLVWSRELDVGSILFLTGMAFEVILEGLGCKRGERTTHVGKELQELHDVGGIWGENDNQNISGQVRPGDPVEMRPGVLSEEALRPARVPINPRLQELLRDLAARPEPPQGPPAQEQEPSPPVGAGSPPGVAGLSGWQGLDRLNIGGEIVLERVPEEPNWDPPDF